MSRAVWKVNDPVGLTTFLRLFNAWEGEERMGVEMRLTFSMDEPTPEAIAAFEQTGERAGFTLERVE